MDQYSLGDEGALPSEMHLPSFSESQGLNCSDTLNRDLGPNTRGFLYAGLSGLDPDPSLPTPDMSSEVLEDNLDTLSLYSGKDSDSVKLLEEYADSESQASLQDLGLGVLKAKEADEGGRATSGSARKGKRQHSSPQNPLLDCSLCGKVFSSASSLSKHYLTHSQERKHVCKICSKAFKRQDHLNQQNGSPTDWTKPRSTFVCKNCSQMFYTEKGLSSHMCFHSDQWPSPRGKQEPQVFGTEFCKPLRQVLRPEGDRHSPPGTKKPLDPTAAAPLVVPQSIPVVPVTRHIGSMAMGQEKDGEERDSKESSQQRKRKKRPPPSTAGEPGPAGCHQSRLRSPMFLVDCLLKGLFQCSPYTPPPMLSPIREGSGVYFNTLCSTSTQASPDQLISSMLDQVDGSFGICVVKDDTKISIEPHINIGSRFQAEIPELQERSLAGTDEHVASLVWKPWGDMMISSETQDRVTELCNVACSSVMPGGGTNLELALHCLHEAQGNVQVALETLLLRGPHKPRTHLLADYRYTGSDVWTPIEKRLFKKAFYAHKKDFYLIHKMIQTKTVAQCVEYYYIWKKMIKFDCGRAPGLEKRVKREPEEVERTEEKVPCSPRERPSHHPTPKLKTKSYRRESILSSSPNAGSKRTPELLGSAESQGIFPCRECERVFDKIKSRNAHMKRHRLQDHVEPIIRVKWPVKPFQLKEEELGADIGPLQW
ncbi:zinc finger protein 541 isoform X9 [Homo sapiens]|uniref:zinc finger protein 541 isoform X9 n=1 Tax=Homo sapiens TaxID=9606 RepID=UPI000387C848|nr:zinc finger protein 541 isoform X9 [Homo sapiens]XP_054178305.1 zinc finger protein 541 isoform X9 [Homo sapiens]|eukprot:XP_005259371.1 zinc finger protein 541 isoform X8 [Homo sapiens]